MSGVAVFTGAGASKAFGFPLTNELLPKIKKGLEAGDIFGEDAKDRQEARALDEYLNALLPGFKLDGIELPLITDVLSLIDYSLSALNSPLPLKSAADIQRFRTLLERAIFAVLRWSYARRPPDELTRLNDWLYSVSREGADGVGLISTNYDIAIENDLFKRFKQEARAEQSEREALAEQFDFGSCWRDHVNGTVYKRPQRPAVRLYKLHGSLNWLRCELCEHIYINTNGVIAQHAFDTRIYPENTCHCGHAILRSVLVAPSLVRDIRDGNLLEIWKNALEFLRTADEWVIIGYSFPPEDIAIRSLFIRAYQGRRWGRPPRIRVVQKGDDNTTRSRYKLFFPDCVYETGGLEGFIATLPSDAGRKN